MGEVSGLVGCEYEGMIGVEGLGVKWGEGEGGKLDLENVKISGEAQALAGANENDYHWGGGIPTHSTQLLFLYNIKKYYI